MKNKKIAVWEKGEDSTYINCEFNGEDIGLLDEGKRTSVIDSKARTSRLHQRKWHEKLWGKILVGLAIALIAGITLYFFKLK